MEDKQPSDSELTPEKKTITASNASSSSSDEVTFRINKKILYRVFYIAGGLTIIGLIIAGLTKFGALNRFSTQFRAGDITLVVSDVESQKLLKGIRVSVVDQADETDDNGQVRFTGLPTGQQVFQFSSLVYQDKSEEVPIHRGDNGTVFVKLERLPPATKSVAGTVLDLVNRTGIPAAEIALGGETEQATSTGNFMFASIEPGQYDLIFSHPDYRSLQMTLDVTQSDQDVGQIQLTPAGKILFVSNRDGNRAVYTANLDGTEAAKLWENKADTDDYSVTLSPDKSTAAFFSNRDQEKDNYGNVGSKLYYTQINPVSIQKISDDLNPSLVEFTPDNSALIFLVSHYDADQQKSMTVLKKYEFTKDKLQDLVSNQDFSSDGAGVPNLYLSETAVSPDSNWVAFYASVYGASASPNGIYIIRRDGGGLRLLIRRSSVFDLEFSKDGGSIIYSSYTNEGKKSFEYDLEKGLEQEVNPETTSVLNTTGGPQAVFSPAEVESKDGSKTAFRDFRDGKTDLFVKDKDGGNERRLTNFGGVNQIYWLKDRYIIFSVQRESESAAYLVGLTPESTPLKITDIHDSSALAGVLP